MSRIKPHHVTRTLLVVLIAAFVIAILRPGNAAPGIGESAPDFELSDLDGRKVKLSDYRGKVVVLNFWATWCPPCVQEMPSLTRLHESLGPRGVTVVTVSVDEDEQALRRFVANHGVRVPVLRDPGRTVSNRYQTYKYPETYILDRQGRLVEKVIGERDWSDAATMGFVQRVAGS